MGEEGHRTLPLTTQLPAEGTLGFPLTAFPIPRDTRTVTGWRGRYLAGILVLCFMLAATAGSATAACLVGGPNGVCFPFPDLDFRMTARVSPQSLPTGKPAPVAFRIGGRVRHVDGTQPSALREAILTVDKDVDVSIEGLPLCNDREPRFPIRRPDELRRLEKRCRNAIVGRGRVGISIAFPGQEPLSLSNRVALLNAGTRDGTILLYALTEIRVPVPQLLAATIEIRRGPARGWTVRAKIPAIAGGSGAITHFALNVGKRFRYRGKRKSFLSASCPDGVFRIMTPKLLFKNEARIPGVAAQTVLKGSLAVPCKPKG